MNALNKDLKKVVNYFEKEAVKQQQESGDFWRLKFHLMPPTGWLNDPNGLCFHNGEYHVFFQYAPFDCNGGLKLWGHYKSKDLIHWQYLEPALYPDQPYDIHGVYSGSALSEDGKLYLFYTGNVKLAGDYNYITDGRQGNTVLAVSEDGISFDDKQLLMSAADYPDNLTCHVRDPKVWQCGEDYYMVQGARTKEDIGQVLLFQSKDKYHWTLQNILKAAEPFGYMWECPDLFQLDGKTVLMVSPQGVEQQGLLYQNLYQSGYYLLEGDFRGEYALSSFEEWDYGYDFYAPQTFEAPDGRRILIGWMGMPDVEADYQNPTISRGWQHVLTFPRELEWRAGRIFQKPIHELVLLETRTVTETLALAKERFIFSAEEEIFHLDLTIHQNNGTFEMILKDSITLTYDEGIFSLKFINGCGFGRSLRQTTLTELKSVEVLCDTSAIEIFLNGGEKTMTSRYYTKPAKTKIVITSEGLKADYKWAALE